MGYATPLSMYENSLVVCTVQVSEGDAVLAAGSAGLIRAQRAEGCLLQPQKGDSILVALTDDNEAWVLSVLRRCGGKAKLRLPEKTDLLASELRFSSEKLALQADTLDMKARNVSLTSENAHISASILSMGGKVLLQSFAAVRTVIGYLSEKALRRSGNYGKMTHTIEELAETRAGRIRVNAEESFRLRAENADLRARGQMDLDGEHIKLG